jgi:Zn-dependent M16 (insulinase) family peptidase
MKDVRELCSLERVQACHKEHYHLRNMWIMLCGNFDENEMLLGVDILDSDENNTPPANFDRPFTGIDAPGINRHRSESIVVKGPSEDEDEGIVQIGFLGRPAWVNLKVV